MRFEKWARLKSVRAFGAPVYVHWTVWVVAVVLTGAMWSSSLYAPLVVACYLAIIVIHECGHAWMARRRGYEVTAIRIAGFHGTCEHEAAEYEWDDVAIAWGGVLAQIAVAIPAVLLYKWLPAEAVGCFWMVFTILGRTNLIVAAMNLLPAPGLDGEKAWRIIPLARDWWISRRATQRVLRKWTRR